MSEDPMWDEAMASMVREQDALIHEGLWRNGQRTLLQAVGLQYDEKKMCAGVAWLLRPDSWHGLGTRFLVAVLRELGFTDAELEAARVARTSVITEELRDDTRADIVIRVPELGTVVVEAKIKADEQAKQADRLHRLWSDEGPRCVFLTRDGGLPRTAVLSESEWVPLTWIRLHELLVPLGADASSGARDLIESLGNLGGAQRGG